MYDLAKIKEIAGPDCEVESHEINGVECVRLKLSSEPSLELWQKFSEKASEIGLQPIFVADDEEPEWNVDEQFSVLQNAYKNSETSTTDSSSSPPANSPTNPFANFAEMADAIDKTAVNKAVDALTHPDHPLAGAMKNISQNFGIDIKQAAGLLNTEGLKGVMQTHFATLANMASGLTGQVSQYELVQKLEFEPLRQAVGDDKLSVKSIIEAANTFDIDRWVEARNTPAPVIGSSTIDKQEFEPKMSQTLLLVPVTEAWQIPAVLRTGGIDENPWPHVHAALWKRWYDRYKCLPLSIGSDIVYLYLSVPVTEDAVLAAKEMAAYSPYTLRGDFYDGTLSGVAIHLNGAHIWQCFWG